MKTYIPTSGAGMIPVPPDHPEPGPYVLREDAEACRRHNARLTEALRSCRSALVELSDHPSQVFADEAPEFNAGGIGFEAISAADSALAAGPMAN